MREYLIANLSNEERSYTANLRDDPTVDELSFIQSIFNDLGDPLLSVDDLAELWGDRADRGKLQTAADQLVSRGVLEQSERTQRPFDSPGTKLFRNSRKAVRKMTITALESQDPEGQSRFQFSLDGRLVRGFARVDRLDSLAGTGNQRAEIKSHVEKIKSGISSGTHVPNPILLVFLDGAVHISEANEEPPDDLPESFISVRPLENFQETYSEDGHLLQRARLVEINFPWRKAAFDEEKSVLLVDGQQRTAAISLIPSEILSFVDIGVSAVIADEERAKRVFQVANETVKISTDFSKPGMR